MALNPGAINDNGDFLDQDCMARYMEKALPVPSDPEDSGKVGRRQFLVAISTGVVDYLKAHQLDGFIVHFDSSTGTLEVVR
jgi:hypothetical protein